MVPDASWVGVSLLRTLTREIEGNEQGTLDSRECLSAQYATPSQQPSQTHDAHLLGHRDGIHFETSLRCPKDCLTWIDAPPAVGGTWHRQGETTTRIHRIARHDNHWSGARLLGPFGWVKSRIVDFSPQDHSLLISACRNASQLDRSRPASNSADSA